MSPRRGLKRGRKRQNKCFRAGRRQSGHGDLGPGQTVERQGQCPGTTPEKTDRQGLIAARPEIEVLVLGVASGEKNIRVGGRLIGHRALMVIASRRDQLSHRSVKVHAVQGRRTRTGLDRHRVIAFYQGDGRRHRLGRRKLQRGSGGGIGQR